MRFLGISIGRKEDSILDGVGQHLGVVRKTVDAFVGLVHASAKGDDQEAAVQLKAVLDGESKADEVHRDLSMRIAQGAFFGGVREDMLNLLEKIDNIADSAKDAARLLGQEEQLDQFSRSILGSEDMQKFLANLVGAVSALEELISALKLGRKETLSRIHKVEEAEEAADQNKVDLLRALFASGQKPDPVTVIQMRDFLSGSDDIADNSEDASDVVLVLIAKGYD